MLFSKNIFRRSLTVMCVLAVLLSAGCGKDSDKDAKATESIDESVSSSVPKKTDPAISDTDATEAITTELGTTPVALEPEELVNLTDEVPPEYRTTLINYKAMAQAVVNNDAIDNGDGTFSSPHFPYPLMSHSITEAKPKLKDPTLDTFGYAVKDINGDGSAELFLMCDNGALLEIYTIHKGEAKLALFFWPGYTGAISESGELYSEMLNSSTMMDYYAIETLDAENGYFVAVRRLGHNTTDSSGEVLYYENKGENEFSVPKSEYDDFLATFPYIPKFGEENTSPSDVLKFIPISNAK